MTHFLGVMVTSHLHLSGPVLSHVNYSINSSVSFVVPLLADSKKNCRQLERKGFALILFFGLNNYTKFCLNKNLLLTAVYSRIFAILKNVRITQGGRTAVIV